MKNVTITMEPELARWARMKAAERMKSLSRFIVEMLEQQRAAERERAVASPAQAFFDSLTPGAFVRSGERVFDRQLVHERDV